jgi:hypothetical protein
MDKSVSRRLTILLQKIPVALQGLRYDVFSAEQMATKGPSPEGASHISLTLFLRTLEGSHKPQNIFKLRN